MRQTKALREHLWYRARYPLHLRVWSRYGYPFEYPSEPGSLESRQRHLRARIETPLDERFKWQIGEHLYAKLSKHFSEPGPVLETLCGEGSRETDPCI